MKQEQVTEALKSGHSTALADLDRPNTLCEFATGVEQTLRKLAEQAGFFEKLVIGWVAGKVKDWRVSQGCP